MMALPVKTEHEHRQDKCLHLLKILDDKTRRLAHTDGERDFKYECVRCGKLLKIRNGVLMNQ